MLTPRHSTSRAGPGRGTAPAAVRDVARGSATCPAGGKVLLLTLHVYSTPWTLLFFFYTMEAQQYFLCFRFFFCFLCNRCILCIYYVVFSRALLPPVHSSPRGSSFARLWAVRKPGAAALVTSSNAPEPPTPSTPPAVGSVVDGKSAETSSTLVHLVCCCTESLNPANINKCTTWQLEPKMQSCAPLVPDRNTLIDFVC